jgi:plasmid maintenance system killer protein
LNDIISSLVPPFFIKLATIIQQDQRAQQVEAQLEAALKKKLTLDMSKALEATLAAEPTLAHESMEASSARLLTKSSKNRRRRKTKHPFQKL